jgi:hypothetical protein
MEQMLMEGFVMYDANALGEEEGFEDENDVDAEAYYKLVHDGSQDCIRAARHSRSCNFSLRSLP